MPLKNDGNNIDPYKHRKRLENWEKRQILKVLVNGKWYELSKVNNNIITEYLQDMKAGLYTARKKPLSPIRLNSVRQRVAWISYQLEQIFGLKDITKATQQQATKFFNDMLRNGKIKSRYGNPYASVDSYVFQFKAFWHWYMRKYNENGAGIKDITIYLDASPVKDNTFVYFTIDDLKKVSVRAKYEHRVLMWFLFDSGIRSPTELMNIKVSDLIPIENSNIYELNIRNEISKTFGRKIKLMMCSDLIKDYIAAKQFKQNDYLFPITPFRFNEYLKRLFDKIFGNKMTKGGEPYNKVSMYDFRHASACYWLPRYKNESALKYRFGWKENDMIHHYSKLLGMKDTISEQDLLLDSEVKTKLEKELELQKQENQLIKEQIEIIRQEQEKFKREVFEMFKAEAKQKIKKQMGIV